VTSGLTVDENDEIGLKRGKSGLILSSGWMNMLAPMKLLGYLLATTLLAACTPGGLPASGGGGGGGGPTSVTIDVNLTNHQAGPTPAGQGGGYAPLVTTVAVGSTIHFVNSDGFAHTATSVPGLPQTFPNAYPFTASALNQTGHGLSGGWSSGTLPAGASSQPLLADQPGTYVFGCFYHYGAPMRGEIVVH
jgi:plastocyanin